MFGQRLKKIINFMSNENTNETGDNTETGYKTYSKTKETMSDGDASVPTIDLEKSSLDAHVDLCSARFQNLDSRLNKIEEKVDHVHSVINEGNHSTMRVVIGAAGTVVAGLLSTIVVLLMNI